MNTCPSSFQLGSVGVLGISLRSKSCRRQGVMCLIDLTCCRCSIIQRDCFESHSDIVLIPEDVNEFLEGCMLPCCNGKMFSMSTSLQKCFCAIS